MPSTCRGYPPQGAFYVYAGCSRLTEDSFAFARNLLDQTGVASMLGIDFGANAPEHRVRFAYTNSIERLPEGARRIGEFLRTRSNRYIRGYVSAHGYIH